MTFTISLAHKFKACEAVTAATATRVKQFHTNITTPSRDSADLEIVRRVGPTICLEQSKVRRRHQRGSENEGYHAKHNTAQCGVTGRSSWQ